MECATRLNGVGIDAGARVPAASAPVVADVCCGPFLSVASSANISADAHIGVARVGVVPQDSAVSLVSDVSVACPVSELTGAQSALASSVSEGVRARLEKSPEASVGARRSVDEPKVVPGGGSAG